MTFISWLHHLPVFAQAAALAAFVSGLVKFGYELIKFLESWRNWRKPPCQPTLDDVKKVERIVLHSSSSSSARDLAIGATLATSCILAVDVLLDHHKHIEAVSNSAAVEADWHAEHIVSVADVHTVVEHADSLTDILSSIFDFL